MSSRSHFGRAKDRVSLITLTDMPVNVISLISSNLHPVERIYLESMCKKLRNASKFWKDIKTILLKSYLHELDEYSVKIERKKKKNSVINTYIKEKNFVTVYHAQLTTYNGTTYTMYSDPLRILNMKTIGMIFKRCINLNKLIIVGACLNDSIIPALVHFENTLKVIKFWNCEEYFDKKRKPCELIKTLFSFPYLSSIMILSTIRPKYTTSPDHNIVKYKLHPELVSCILAPIQEIQLTNLAIPLKSFKILTDRLCTSLERLSIGCTYGDAKKVNSYAKALTEFENLKDLDLPPFIFSINEDYLINLKVYNALCITKVQTFGFRHYNTSALFKFIRNDLPPDIKVVRIFHNPGRIPNFKQLGYGPTEKKISVTSKISKNSNTSGSNNSIVGVYSRSIFKALRIKKKIHLDDFPNHSPRDSILYNIDKNGHPNGQFGIGNGIPRRELSIFAVEESCRSVEKLIHKKYNCLDVYYTSDVKKYQEVVGKMASPMPLQHPFKLDIDGSMINSKIIPSNSITRKNSEKNDTHQKPVTKFFNLLRFKQIT
uniref:F-box domain-containing protein n=1 Tax=Strongyloides venezuelensis TaxID=75913 RepID=A0A0K0FUG9_STRVS